MEYYVKPCYSYFQNEAFRLSGNELLKPSLKTRVRWVYRRLLCFFTGHNMIIKAWVNSETNKISEYHRGCIKCPKFEVIKNK